MATIHTLAASGAVKRVHLDLPRREFEDRFIYLSEQAHAWLSDTLPELHSIHPDADLSPHEQVFHLFRSFIIGRSVKHWHALHIMHPDDMGVWELKTLDVRLIGWFPVIDHFVIGRADSMERCKTHKLYPGYRDETVRLRETLGLDTPTFVPGGALSDVLSNAD